MNIPPRKVYEAAVLQKTLIHAHIPRVEAKLTRYADGSWERKVMELELLRWFMLCDVLDAVCNGKTVQPS